MILYLMITRVYIKRKREELQGFAAFANYTSRRVLSCVQATGECDRCGRPPHPCSALSR